MVRHLLLEFVSSVHFSHFLDESVLELINILHQLLVHLDLLHGYLPRVCQVVPHIIVFFIFDGSFESGDHFAFPLDELHFFFDSIQMGVVNVLFSSHSFLFESLGVHHAIGTHFQVSIIVLLHNMIIGAAIVAVAGVHRHLWRAHKGCRR